MTHETHQYEFNFEEPVTGPTQLNSHNPGVYIIADHALYYKVMLHQVLSSYGTAKSEKDVIALNAMGDLITLLKSCDEKTDD